ERYHQSWLGWRDNITKLHPGAVVHEILQDVPPNYASLPRQIFTGRPDDFPRCDTHTQERVRNDAFEQEVLSIEANERALGEAVANEALRPGALMVAIFRRLIKLEHHVDAVRQEMRDLKYSQPKRGKKS